jgi:hypothetical protein
MKFKTFSRIVVVLLLGLIGGGVYLVGRMTSHSGEATGATSPVKTGQPSQHPPSAVQRLTTAQIRDKLARWLDENPDRGSRMKLVNILPDEAFRATAIRFPEADAQKWSNDTKQWSQLRLDLDRDGVDDEKWLLKNGRLYKREVLDPTGNVTLTEYFDQSN